MVHDVTAFPPDRGAVDDGVNCEVSLAALDPCRGVVSGAECHRRHEQAVLGVDYVRTARSKGLTEQQVVAHHVVRNAIGPALSMGGLQLGFMFAGVVVVEQVFSWPGIGNYLAASIPVADFPAIAGVTLVLGAIYVLSNLVVDLLQALADPRVAAE